MCTIFYNVRLYEKSYRSAVEINFSDSIKQYETLLKYDLVIWFCLNNEKVVSYAQELFLQKWIEKFTCMWLESDFQKGILQPQKYA